MTINEKLKRLSDNVSRVHTAGQQTAPMRDVEISMNGVYTADEAYKGFGSIILKYNPVRSILEETGSAAGLFSKKLYAADSPFVPFMEGLDMSKVEDASQLFMYAKLSELPDYDFSSLKNASYMYRDCDSVTRVQDITGPLETCKHMFYYCRSLSKAPSLNTKNVTDASNMFDYCTSLTSIPRYDLRSCVNCNSFISGCVNVIEVLIYNLNGNINLSPASLTLDNLLYLCKECLINTSHFARTLTIGSTNLAKLANVYVRVLDESEITDEMRAEDDLIDKKLPFVRCESTDEGAILITDYMPLKNWKLA